MSKLIRHVDYEGEMKIVTYWDDQGNLIHRIERKPTTKEKVLHIWKLPCYLCGQPMREGQKLDWHHIIYFPKEIKRLVHGSCHAKVTHSKANPFPHRYRPSSEESKQFYHPLKATKNNCPDEKPKLTKFERVVSMAQMGNEKIPNPNRIEETSHELPQQWRDKLSEDIKHERRFRERMGPYQTPTILGFIDDIRRSREDAFKEFRQFWYGVGGSPN